VKDFRIILLFVGLLFLSTTSMTCVSDKAGTSGGSGWLRAGPFELGGRWEVDSDGTGGQTLTVINRTGQTQEGCIVFTDGQGNVISIIPAKLPPGGAVTVPVPPGTKNHHVANGVDCSTKAHGSVGPRAIVQAVPSGKRFHFGATHVVDFNNPNVDDWVWGVSPDPWAFTQTVNDILDKGYEYDLQIQAGVTDVDAFLIESIVLPGNDIQATIANNSTFTNVDLWVNGVHVLSMDDGFEPTTLGAGWDAHTFVLPAGLPEFNYSPVTGDEWSNEFEFHFTRVGDPQSYTITRQAAFISE
jgi:hypothetical protein